MLSVVINGETHEVTAEHFRTLVDVAVRIMKDAARGTGIDFAVTDLHASSPTIAWGPLPTGSEIDVDAEYAGILNRVHEGIEFLENGEGSPGWMSESTAKALYAAASEFGETEVDGVSFVSDSRRHTDATDVPHARPARENLEEFLDSHWLRLVEVDRRMAKIARDIVATTEVRTGVDALYIATAELVEAEVVYAWD